MIVGQLGGVSVARGFKNFIILGSCGSVGSLTEADKIILPAAALRDEGTSYSLMLPPGDEVAYDDSLLTSWKLSFDKLRYRAYPHQVLDD